MKHTLFFIARQLTRVLPLAYMALIWYLSSYPSTAVVDTGLSFDASIKEALHLIEFALLYLLFVLSLRSLGQFNPKANFLAALIAIFYGLVDEFHQYFVPSRSCTLIDFLKDATGVLVAWYIVSRFYSAQGSKVTKSKDTVETKLAGELTREP